MFMIYLMLSSVFRFSVEFLRLNPRLLFGLSEAQLIAVPLFFGLGLVVHDRKLLDQEADRGKSQKPCVACVMVGLVQGIMGSTWMISACRHLFMDELRSDRRVAQTRASRSRGTPRYHRRTKTGHGRCVQGRTERSSSSVYRER